MNIFDFVSGQRVRITDSVDHEYDGQLGTVIEVSYPKLIVHVQPDHLSTDLPYLANELEIVED